MIVEDDLGAFKKPTKKPTKNQPKTNQKPTMRKTNQKPTFLPTITNHENLIFLLLYLILTYLRFYFST
jgi:hypothetical protein